MFESVGLDVEEVNSFAGITSPIRISCVLEILRNADQDLTVHVENHTPC